MEWVRGSARVGFRLAVVAALGIAVGCQSPHAEVGQTEVAGPGPSTVDSLKRALEETLEKQGVPGGIFAVRKGGVTRVAAAGLADVATGRPMETVDPFQLGSIAKVYTATVVLQLVEEGRLSLDEPLADFFPEFPNAAATQLRDLLQHTSGLADVAAWAYFRPAREEMISLVTKQWTRDELLAAAEVLPPDFAPGEDWSYSNTNFILLAAIVEEVTGEPFVVELRRRVFEPLGLERSWQSRYEDDPVELATTGYLGPLPFWPHSEMFGELGPTTSLDGGNMEWGAGGVVASAEEAAEFLAALLDGRLISPDSLLGMQGWVATGSLGAPGPDTPPDLEDGYGLGLIRVMRPGYQMIGHGGIYNGHTAGLWHVPECEATVAFYLNRGFSDGRALMDRWFREADCQGG